MGDVVGRLDGILHVLVERMGTGSKPDRHEFLTIATESQHAERPRALSVSPASTFLKPPSLHGSMCPLPYPRDEDSAAPSFVAEVCGASLPAGAPPPGVRMLLLSAFIGLADSIGESPTPTLDSLPTNAS